MWTNHLLKETPVKAYVFLKNKPLELQVHIRTQTSLEVDTKFKSHPVQVVES